jgi:hypothetical protein
MPSEFRKIPHAEAFKGFFVVAQSVFTFIQDTIRGDQITSLMLGALGGLIVTLRALRMLNSRISPLADLLVLLPAIDVCEIMRLITDFQYKDLSWNLI